MLVRVPPTSSGVIYSAIDYCQRRPQILTVAGKRRRRPAGLATHARDLRIRVRRFVTTGTFGTFTAGKSACIRTRREILLAVRTILFRANGTTRNRRGSGPTFQYSCERFAHVTLHVSPLSP